MNLSSTILILFVSLILRLVWWDSGSTLVSEILQISLPTSLARIVFPVAGTLGVLGVILVTRRLFPIEKNLSLFAGIFAGVNPWGIGMGQNLYPELFVFTIAVWCVFFFLGKRMFFGVLLFASTFLISYVSIFFSLGLLALLCLKTNLRMPTYLLIVLFLLFSFSVFGAWHEGVYFSGKYLSLFREIGYINHINELRGQESAFGYAPFGKLFFNKSYFLLLAVDNFLRHFNPSYLFARGGSLNPAYVGPVFIVFLPFFLLGLKKALGLVKEKSPQVIILWWLLAALPGIFLGNAPQDNIYIMALFPISVVTAFGLLSLKKRAVLIFICFLIINMAVVTFQILKYGAQ